MGCPSDDVYVRNAGEIGEDEYHGENKEDDKEDDGGNDDDDVDNDSDDDY